MLHLQSKQTEYYPIKGWTNRNRTLLAVTISTKVENVYMYVVNCVRYFGWPFVRSVLFSDTLICFEDQRYTPWLFNIIYARDTANHDYALIMLQFDRFLYKNYMMRLAEFTKIMNVHTLLGI